MIDTDCYFTLRAKYVKASAWTVYILPKPHGSTANMTVRISEKKKKKKWANKRRKEVTETTAAALLLT